MVVSLLDQLSGIAFFDEGAVDDQFGLLITKLADLPHLDLALERSKVPLHFVYTNRYYVKQVELCRVLVENRTEIAFEGHVVADKYAIPNGHGKPQTLVVRISNSD